jgi:ComF family protein
MLRLKYNRDMGLGESLAQHLIDTYRHTGWQVDLVSPVPISAQRMKERGYNQAGLLAMPLAWSIGVPYQPEVLRKFRETRSQVGLTAHQRAENVADAFEAIPALVRNKRILVIDDVTTTGSTIRACAKALRSAGASAVFGLTLARAATPQADADDLPNPTDLNGGTNGG